MAYARAMSNERSRTTKSLSPLFVALAAGCAWLWGGCSSGDDATDPNDAGGGDEVRRLPDSPTRPSADVTLRRERVAVQFAKQSFKAAREELQPLLDAKSPAAEDLVRAAQLSLAQGDFDEAVDFVGRALEAEPDLPGAVYTAARVAFLNDELEEAERRYRRALELAPGDPPSLLGLSKVYQRRYFDEDDEAAPAEARALLEQVIDLGLPNGVQWYVTAIYQRSRLAVELEEADETKRLYAGRFQSLTEAGYQAAKGTDLDQGTLARVAAPEPFGTFPSADPGPVTFGEPRVFAPVPQGTDAVWISDLDGDRAPDLLTRAGGSVVAHLRDRKTGELDSFELVDAGATGPVRVADLNQARGGDTLDALVAVADQVRVFEQSDELDQEREGARWEASPVLIQGFGGTVRDFQPVDFDHEGDLDLFVVGEFGARLLRNDGAGAGEPGTGAGLLGGRQRGCDPPELTARVVHHRGLRRGQRRRPALRRARRRAPHGFAAARALRRSRPGGVRGAAFERPPLVLDFDGNGYPDLFVPGAESSDLYLQRYEPWDFHRIRLDIQIPAEASVCAEDVDFDGAVDLLWSTADGGAAGVLAVGLTTSTPFTVPPLEDTGMWMAARDVDPPDPYGELNIELCRMAGGELVVQSPTSQLDEAIFLKFVGVKDNRQGVGAVVEVRARDVYRRVYWRGESETIGIGEQKYVDVVRVTWPNGVVQQELDVEAGVTVMLDDEGFGEQPEGLIGSCPFLYAWNGETFEFISDVIGITPLGLPMAPGMLVPPDHDEYVLVRGDQLVPDANGDLVLQFTEELREVTYLDRIRLDVIDHPEGSAIYPNERFTFPPFPQKHTHVVERAAKPARATGSDGSVWTEELREIDMRHAVPFRRLGGQFLGLAEPHWLELEFDPRGPRGGEADPARWPRAGSTGATPA